MFCLLRLAHIGVPLTPENIQAWVGRWGEEWRERTYTHTHKVRNENEGITTNLEKKSKC